MGVWFAIAIRRILGFYTLGTHFHRDIKAILNVWAFASKVFSLNLPRGGKMEDMGGE